MTITLSLDAILAHILAESAIRYTLHDQAPKLLTADNTLALESLVRARFSIACLDLLPILEDLDDGQSTGSRQLTARLHSVDSATAIVLQHALEHSIAIGTLADIYTDSAGEAADSYAEAFDQTRLSLRDIVVTSTLGSIASLGPIAPWRF